MDIYIYIFHFSSIIHILASHSISQLVFNFIYNEREPVFENKSIMRNYLGFCFCFIDENRNKNNINHVC